VIGAYWCFNPLLALTNIAVKINKPLFTELLPELSKATSI